MASKGSLPRGKHINVADSRAALPVIKFVLAALREEGYSGGRFTFDAVLNPPEDGGDIDIRSLRDICAAAKPGDVIDVYVYKTANGETNLWDNVEVTAP